MILLMGFGPYVIHKLKDYKANSITAEDLFNEFQCKVSLKFISRKQIWGTATWRNLIRPCPIRDEIIR